METAKKYNLIFQISEMDGFTRRPCIGVNNIDGNSLNLEIASFLEPNGLEFIQHIKNEILSLNYNFEFKEDYIWGYHEYESVEIRCFPPKAVAIFNTGGTEVKLPIEDFLKILEEWKAFVEAVPKPHWLDQR